MYKHDECTQGMSADAALYDRFATSIFGYAKLFATSWEDAEDVTLEVFTAALEQGNLSSLNEQQQLAWLRGVAHNKLVDRYRRSLRLPVVPLEQVVETARIEEGLTPEQVVLRPSCSRPPMVSKPGRRFRLRFRESDWAARIYTFPCPIVGHCR